MSAWEQAEAEPSASTRLPDAVRDIFCSWTACPLRHWGGTEIFVEPGTLRILSVNERASIANGERSSVEDRGSRPDYARLLSISG